MSSHKRRSPFAIVPVEVLADDRLTLRHIRVLVAILSFRSVDTGIAFPTREEIGERARLPITRVSTITSELEKFGWLKKEGNGGRSRASRYRFCVPEDALETVTESDTVTKTVTVTESDQNGYRIGNETVTETVTGIEQTNTDQEQTNTTPAKRPSLSFRDLTGLGVDEQVASEFLALRKRKRAPLTPLALQGIRREADRVGWTLDQALRKCIERGWQGFESGWVSNDRAVVAAGAIRHGNFSQQNYHAGVGADGSF